MKTCEKCGVQIPDDYQNLLCDEHYAKEAENALKRPQNDEGGSGGTLQFPASELVSTPVIEAIQGIRDPRYTENPEKDDKEQWLANITLFQHNKVLLWKPTRSMYNFIKNWCLTRVTAHPQYPKFIWKPQIVDVGCGSGVGSNVLSQEADFVWGIDKNENSIRFAKESFERVKNGIYYSSQLTFDHVDFMTDTREFMKFDVVVAIEVVEHIADATGFIKRLIEKFDNKKTGDDATRYFISTPNRNNKTIQKDRPKNPYHVREWTSEEMYDVLSEFFVNVQLHSAAGVPTERSSTHTPLLAICSQPKA